MPRRGADGRCFSRSTTAASAPTIASLRCSRSFGWRGHFFITTGRIGSAGFVNEAQIRDLRRRGHVIGSHSSTHPTRMSYLPWEQMERRMVGEQVVSGRYSWRASEDRVCARWILLQEGGAGRGARAHRGAVQFGAWSARAFLLDGCLVAGRYAIMRDTPPAISGAIAGGSLLPRWKQSVLWKAKKIAKAAGGCAYLRVREAC